MKKEVSIIGIVGIPANYSGFETLAEQLTANTSENIRYTVYCSNNISQEKPDKHNGATLKYLSLDANGVQSIFYDLYAMLCAIWNKADTILIMGVSGCIFLPFIRMFGKKCPKIVTNIDGLEWKRDKWGKYAKKFLKFSEKIAVKYSHEIVADNQGIVDHVQEAYGASANLIAYGGDHALHHNEIVPLDKIIPYSEGEYGLALCRIEPENNVHVILEGFRGTQTNLVFVGNWDRSRYGRELKLKYKDDVNITILDAIFDPDILFALRNSCNFYAHGHSAGGTNPSLVEMMYFGKPIICFDCNYNRFSTENKAQYFTDGENLRAITQNINYEAGVELTRIAKVRYRWSNVALDYENLY